MLKHQQMRHAEARAKAILANRLAALKTQCSGVQLTPDQKLKALKAGDFRVNKVKDGYSRWWEQVEFPAETPFDQARYDAGKKELEAAHARLMDELILGDAEEALKLLRAFEAAA